MVKHGWLGLAVAALASAGCAGVKHARVSPATAVLPVSALDAIGGLTQLQESGGTLYVAGQRGVAAVGPDGAVQWTVELPPRALRWIAVDGERVAFSAFDIGEGESKGLRFTFDGVEKPSYSGCAVGVVTAQGALSWSVDCDPGIAASPPAFGGDVVAVSHGKWIVLYDASTGAAKAKVDQATNTLFGLREGLILQASLNRPLYAHGAFFGGHFNHFVKVSPSGQRLEDRTRLGLLTPIENVTAAPVAVGDLVVFAVGRSEGDNPAVVAANASGDEAWTKKVLDTSSDICSLAYSNGRIFAATSFAVAAFEPNGRKAWERRGEAVRAGTFGGCRAVSGTFTTRKWQGSLLQSDGEHLYLASAVGDGDGITVLGAAKGEYVKTIQVGTPIVDMALVGDHLAVAAAEGLQLIPLEGGGSHKVPATSRTTAGAPVAPPGREMSKEGTRMTDPAALPAARPVRLADEVAYAPGSVVSRTLVKSKGATLTLFAFDEGQELSERTAPSDALVTVLEGEAELTVGGAPIRAPAGETVLVPAGVPHAVKALGRCKVSFSIVREPR
jgi:quercetin dioxygenase-like cupin family protein